MFVGNLQYLISTVQDCLDFNDSSPWSTVDGDTKKIRFEGVCGDGMLRTILLNFQKNSVLIEIPLEQLSEEQLRGFLNKLEYALEQKFLQNIRINQDHDANRWKLEIED